jgi:hypothetical protein
MNEQKKLEEQKAEDKKAEERRLLELQNKKETLQIDNSVKGLINDNITDNDKDKKKLGFILSECYKKQYGIKTVNLIISNSYGPGDYMDEERTHAMNGIIMRMIKAKNNNDPQFTLWGTGTPVREWIYMEDAAKIIKLIIDDEMYDNLPNPINLGQQHGVSIMDTVMTVKSALNYDVEIVCDTTKQDGAPVKVLGNQLFKKHFSSFTFTCGRFFSQGSFWLTSHGFSLWRLQCLHHFFCQANQLEIDQRFSIQRV